MRLRAFCFGYLRPEFLEHLLVITDFICPFLFIHKLVSQLLEFGFVLEYMVGNHQNIVSQGDNGSLFTPSADHIPVPGAEQCTFGAGGSPRTFA